MGKHHKNFRRRKQKLLNMLGALATDAPQYFGHSYATVAKELNNADSPAERIAQAEDDERERREALAAEQRRDRLRRLAFTRGEEVTAPRQEETGGTAEGDSVPENLGADLHGGGGNPVNG